MTTTRRSMLRPLIVVAGAVGVLFCTLLMTGVISFSAQNTITRRVVDVPFEKALVQYVAVLEGVEGVVDASYRDYDPVSKTALVSVTYDPDLTTPRIIMVYFGHTTSIWQKYVMV